MFSGLRAARGERVITRFRSQKIGALFAYLAFYRDRSHAREALIELLWPESDPAVGRQNLRTALHVLRNQLEPPDVPAGSVFKTDRFSVRLNSATVETDVARFEAALRAATAVASETDRAQHLAEAVETYRGELLPGFYFDWVLTEQRRLADLYFGAVRRLTRHFEQAREWDRAIECARRGH